MCKEVVGLDSSKKTFDEFEFLKPTVFRLSAIKWVLKQYGEKNTDDLIDITKLTQGYQEVERLVSDDNKPSISHENMKNSLPVMSIV